MTRRRGFTLVELVVVVTASAILVGLIAGMIHSLRRAARAAEKHLVELEATARLAEQFRRVAYAASEAELAADQATIRFNLGSDRHVEFRSAGSDVSQVETRASQVVHQERFRLAVQGAGRFELDRNKQPVTVRMILTPRDSRQSGSRTRELRVEATLGRDHRFRRGPE